MNRRTKAIVVLASALAVVLSFAGVAYAADGAVPGDSLYGFDCALEDVGIGAGGLEERLTEAAELIDDGEVDEGLAHAAEALVEEDDEDGDDEDGDKGGADDETARREALLAAADAVLSNGCEQSLEVRTRVAEKLRFLATTELTGKEYGQAVSELARGIYGDNPESEDGSSEDTTHGKSNGNRGKPKGHNR